MILPVARHHAPVIPPFPAVLPYPVFPPFPAVLPYPGFPPFPAVLPYPGFPPGQGQQLKNARCRLVQDETCHLYADSYFQAPFERLFDTRPSAISVRLSLSFRK